MVKNKTGCREYFSERLKSLRAEKGISQKVLADELGISKGAVSFYETCQNAPDIEILAKTAKYFDVSFDYLLGESDNRTSDIKLQAVCAYTGLTENAIGKIKNLLKENKVEHLKCLNVICESDEFWKIVGYLAMYYEACAELSAIEKELTTDNAPNVWDKKSKTVGVTTLKRDTSELRATKNFNNVVELLKTLAEEGVDENG